MTHIVTDGLHDLTDLLRSLGGQDDRIPIEHGRGDAVTHPCASDPRDEPGAGSGRPICEIYVHNTIRQAELVVASQRRICVQGEDDDSRYADTFHHIQRDVIASPKLALCCRPSQL